MIRRLRWKFVCINMVLMCTMLVLILSIQYRSTARNLEQSSLEMLQSRALDSSIMGFRPGEGDRGSSQPVFTILELDWGNLMVTGDSYYDLSDETLLKEIYLAASAQEESAGVLESYCLRFYRAESVMGNRYVFTDISAEIQTLRQLRNSCILIWLAAAVGLLVISILLAHWAVKPVANAWAQQRQFVADASHELKTPLTVILTNAELLDEESCDEDTRARLTDGILSMSRQMRALVEQLLQLARADSGQVAAVRENLSLSELVQESVLPFEPLYYEQGLTLESYIAPELRILGSPGHLTQVVDILLDNCCKYSAPGGRVVLCLRRSHNRCLLTVFSPGEPLSAQVCRDIFKRFYRADPARHAQGSYGLGLSIAQSIVADHRGKIWAEPKIGGNLFYVAFPLV